MSQWWQDSSYGGYISAMLNRYIRETLRFHFIFWFGLINLNHTTKKLGYFKSLRDTTFARLMDQPFLGITEHSDLHPPSPQGVSVWWWWWWWWWWPVNILYVAEYL
jgi:hypothetical protein